MGRHFRRILALLAVAPLAVSGMASASIDKEAAAADQAWAEAVDQDTLAGYAHFVMQHPDSRHAGKAHARLTRSKDGLGPSPKLKIGNADFGDPASVPELLPDSIMVV